jgi:hypothetical protein
VVNPTGRNPNEKCAIRECGNEAKKLSLCWKHRKQLQRAGIRIYREQLTPIQRLEYYGWTVTASGCWEFNGRGDKKGYGRVKVGHAYGTTAAHRLSYEAFHGPIPEGMHICHACDNPPCINPDHLWAGTHLENMQDMVAKGRHRGGQTSSAKSSSWT